MGRPRRRRQSASPVAKLNLNRQQQSRPMPEFDYLAIDTAGREKRGKVRADNADDAKARLDARKLFVVKMDAGVAASAPAGRALLARRGKKLSAKELTLFTRQLSTLVQVSPLEESLRTISRQSEQDH